MKFDLNLPNVPEDGMMTQAQGREIVEYLYGLEKYLRYMFAHIDSENLADELSERIDSAGTDEGLIRRVEDAEGNISELTFDTRGMIAAVKNNRLRFSQNGLEIINAAGDVVFKQDNANGNLTITGILRALGGVIGGFTIGDSSLSAGGTQIVLDALGGLVRLGQLTITDSRTYGPVLEAANGLCFVVGGQLYWILANGGITAQRPVFAQQGLYVNPGDPVTYAPNVWMDPNTGLLHRTTGTSGSGGTDPGTNPAAPLSIAVNAVDTYVPAGSTLTVYGSPSGGTPPYSRYLIEAQYNGGSWQTVSDGVADTFTSRVMSPMTIVFMVTVWDSAGNSYAGVSPAVTVY